MHSFFNKVSQAVQTLFVIIVAIVMNADIGRAHELSPAVADLTFEENAFQLRIEMNFEAAIANIGPEHDDTDDSPNAIEYDELRTLSGPDLEQRFGEFSQEFIDGVDIRFNELRADIDVVETIASETGDTELARISEVIIRGAIPEGAESLTFTWAEVLGPIVLRTETDVAEEGYAAFLAGGETSEEIAVEGQQARGMWAVFVDYIAIGFEHILPLGLDHILFVVGLFLLSTQLRPLLLQITAFTLAHTVTLALGMLGIITIPGSIVEPIIAASIVYVAVENILMKGLSPWRPFIVFVFGLLHGLGFAGVLTEFGIPSGQFLPALIGFNIGVELGQLTVIAICFLAVGWWFGHRDWYRARIVIPGSIVVALIGAYWFIERTLL